MYNLKQKVTITCKIKVKKYKLHIQSRTDSKPIKTITLPSLKNSNFENQDKQPERSAHYQQALYVDSSKLIAIYLTEFDDTAIHTDFSCSDNTL